MKTKKIEKVLAYALLATMLGAFLIALIFGVYKAYFVPKISWSNVTEEQMKEMELEEFGTNDPYSIELILDLKNSKPPSDKEIK